MLVFHDEAEDTSPDAAAKAVERLPLWIDMKRWRLFLMKGAECLEIRSRAFQREIRTDDFDDVVCRRDLFDCF